MTNTAFWRPKFFTPGETKWVPWLWLSCCLKQGEQKLTGPIVWKQKNIVRLANSAYLPYESSSDVPCKDHFFKCAPHRLLLREKCPTSVPIAWNASELYKVCSSARRPKTGPGFSQKWFKSNSFHTFLFLSEFSIFFMAFRFSWVVV